jgi:uncharacterized repeat protein (TIGR01451 family)
MAGTGWTCSVSTSSCTRSDTLASGASYLPITVTVNVAANASSPQLNQAGVSGGGSAAANTSDSTTIVTPTPPSLSVTKTHSGSFTQGQQGATYTITVSNASNASATSGTVTVTDTLPSGLTLVSMAGTGWTCSVSTSSCTRSDTLASGGSYLPITVAVNVAANASSPQLNQAGVSGGGSAAANTSDSTVISPVGGSGNSATFVSKDTQTEGSWQGAYGTDGYYFANGPESLPSYASITVQSQLNWTWMASTTDPRALQLPSSTTGIAATWYTNLGPFSFDLNVGLSPHTFAIYALDWDNRGRSESIQIQDADTGASLDTETISNFSNGVYVVWTITGHVHVTVSWLAGPNAVVSGVFFGGTGSGNGTPPPPSSTAQFTGSDIVTQGAWIGTYGSLGYDLANSSQSLPSSIAVSTQNQATWTWAPSSTDPRALQIPGGGALAATWFSAPALTFDVNLTDGLSHQLALYLIDWDNKGRSETIQILDATSGTVIDSETIPGSGTSTSSTNFVNGTYLKWSISGHVKINFLLNGGANAVASGMFFD